MLTTTMMGIPLDNPVVVASGPWTRGSENLRKALESGAGAVVTETIVSEDYPDVCPRYAYDCRTGGLQNIRIYSGQDLEKWLEDLEEVERLGRYGSSTKIIASIMASTASELRYLARKLERAGVDGIEIGLACPMGEGPDIPASDANTVREYVEEVVSAVQIPVSVKLNAHMNNPAYIVGAAETAGISGISAIDTMRSLLDIDLETGRPALPTYGGYSGAPIKPVALATVAEIAQTSTLPIVGMGGIANAKDLLQFLMVGASAGGVGTRILLKGYEVVGEILAETKSWMKDHDVESIEEICGKSLDFLKSFEEIKVEDKKATLSRDCTRSDCDKCQRYCFESAISRKEGVLFIDHEKCNGCGLCVSACPDEALVLGWD